MLMQKPITSTMQIPVLIQMPVNYHANTLLGSCKKLLPCKYIMFMQKIITMQNHYYAHAKTYYHTNISLYSCKVYYYTNTLCSCKNLLACKYIIMLITKCWMISKGFWHVPSPMSQLPDPLSHSPTLHGIFLQCVRIDLTVTDLIWVNGPRSSLQALEAAPRVTYSYQVNNLCYVTILSASSAWKLVNIILNISTFSPDYEKHIIEEIIFCYHAEICQ